MENQIITLRQERWVRSQDGILAGVCSGLSHSFGVDTWLVRLIWLIAVLAFGTGVLAYILLAICLPREDQLRLAYQKRILGVCARLAKKFDLDVGIVRFATVVLGLVSLGVTVVAYIVLHFVLEDNCNAWHDRYVIHN